MNKNGQQLAWDISANNPERLDIFQAGKPTEILMSISLSEVIHAARTKRPGLVVDHPKLNFTLKQKMKTTDKTVLAINGIEALAFALWVKNHLKVCERAKEHGKQNVELHFETSHASGIGQNTYVRCCCGIREEITDVGCW